MYNFYTIRLLFFVRADSVVRKLIYRCDLIPKCHIFSPPEIHEYIFPDLETYVVSKSHEVFKCRSGFLKMNGLKFDEAFMLQETLS